MLKARSKPDLARLASEAAKEMFQKNISANEATDAVLGRHRVELGQALKIRVVQMATGFISLLKQAKT